jgi:DEAD/DEAH box helicase domain-containing protein
VYLHLGRSYLVKHLDLDGRAVLVDDHDGTFYTQAKIDKNIVVAGQAAMRPLAGAALFFGEIEVTEQVIAYQKRDLTDGRVIDTVSLDLP